MQREIQVKRDNQTDRKELQKGRDRVCERDTDTYTHSDRPRYTEVKRDRGQRQKVRVAETRRVT